MSVSSIYASILSVVLYSQILGYTYMVFNIYHRVNYGFYMNQYKKYEYNPIILIKTTLSVQYILVLYIILYTVCYIIQYSPAAYILYSEIFIHHIESQILRSRAPIDLYQIMCRLSSHTILLFTQEREGSAELQCLIVLCTSQLQQAHVVESPA